MPLNWFEEVVIGRLIEKAFFIDNQQVRFRFIGKLIQRSGLLPWGFEFSFPGIRISTFLVLD